jgi:hypothetical protein
MILVDQRTCNGAVPHPYLPYIVSYGIDNTAKVWGFEYDFSDAIEKGNKSHPSTAEDKVKLLPAAIPNHKRLSTYLSNRKRCCCHPPCSQPHDQMDSLGQLLESYRVS